MKRIALWVAPFVALGALVGLLGQRTLSSRERARSHRHAVERAEPVATRGGPRATLDRRRGSSVRKPVLAPPPSLSRGLDPKARAGTETAAPLVDPRVAPLALRAEEAAVRDKLEPLVARQKDADLRFVVCGAFEEPPADVAAEERALDAPPRDPSRPVCRARVQARDRDALGTLLKEASTAYEGRLAAEVREHLDAYTGRWFEADLRVDTDDPQALPTMPSEI